MKVEIDLLNVEEYQKGVPVIACITKELTDEQLNKLIDLLEKFE